MPRRLIQFATMISCCSGFLSPLLGRQFVRTATSRFRAPLLSYIGAPSTSTTTRLFAAASSKQKKKTPKKLSSKQRRKRESEKAKRANEWRAREQKLKRQRNLHKAAKMKRVLSATDYWFSDSNLRTDSHLQEQLFLHKGYIPLKELLTFPKFKYWVDLQLLYQSYTNPAAKKRYRVVISKDLMEHGQQEAKRIEQERRAFEKNRVKREKERKRESKRRARMRKRVRNERYEEVFKTVRQRLFEKYTKDLQKVHDMEQEQQKEALLEESSVRGFLERNRTYTEPVVKVLDAVDSLTSSPSDDDDELTLYDIADEAVHEAISYDYDEEFGAYLELEDLDDEDDENDLDYVFGYSRDEYQPNWQNDWKFSQQQNAKTVTSKPPDINDKELDNDSGQGSSIVLDFDPLMREQDANPSMESPVENENLVSDSTVTDDLSTVEEIVEEEEEDEDDNLEHALVRNKRITFEYLESLRRPTVDLNDYYMDEGYSESFVDEWGNELDSLDETQVQDKPKKPKPNKLKNYKIAKSREVVLIQTPEKLKKFCNELMVSVQKNVATHGDDPNFSAIGLDVEYCTLELDIRNTLPAMLQLAGPGDTAPVGLIWLDKFPNHGRDMLGTKSGKPLLDILTNYEILKVGVGASKDVKNLAMWWGINDRKFVDYYFAGIIDMEYEGNAGDKSLAELCQAVLNKRLPKSKEKLSKFQKKRKKEGRRTPTAHWRRKEITKEMKEYAANDVACGIDVWMKLKTGAVDKDETSSEDALA